MSVSICRFLPPFRMQLTLAFCFQYLPPLFLLLIFPLTFADGPPHSLMVPELVKGGGGHDSVESHFTREMWMEKSHKAFVSTMDLFLSLGINILWRISFLPLATLSIGKTKTQRKFKRWPKMVCMKHVSACFLCYPVCLCSLCGCSMFNPS